MPRVLLHSFRMGDVEDPYLYAAFPISDWQKTEHGQWCMQHAIGQSEFLCVPDPHTLGYQVRITGELTEPNITYLKLRWGQ
jgi:hypothetical protein